MPRTIPPRRAPSPQALSLFVVFPGREAEQQCSFCWSEKPRLSTVGLPEAGWPVEKVCEDCFPVALARLRSIAGRLEAK